jgi:hypothetical protein
LLLVQGGVQCSANATSLEQNKLHPPEAFLQPNNLPKRLQSTYTDDEYLLHCCGAVQSLLRSQRSRACALAAEPRAMTKTA